MTAKIRQKPFRVSKNHFWKLSKESYNFLNQWQLQTEFDFNILLKIKHNGQKETLKRENQTKLMLRGETLHNNNKRQTLFQNDESIQSALYKSWTLLSHWKLIKPNSSILKEVILDLLTQCWCFWLVSTRSSGHHDTALRPNRSPWQWKHWPVKKNS